MSLLASFNWHYIFDMPNLVLLLGTLIAVCGIGAAAWHKTAIATEQLRLKRMMVERGYSPEEIVRVMNAGDHPGQASRNHREAACC
jgi:hypothetical protein